MEFKCQKFELNHSNSSMKVGTDAIILSSCISHNLKLFNIEEILDVGTGCGIIALCMSQVFEKANVTAIDIDENSIKQATENFLHSTFSSRMNARCEYIQKFAETSKQKFDLIVSNPPFYTSCLKSPDKRRTNARHNDVLSLVDFVLSTTKLLKDNGYIAVILPRKETMELIPLFKQKNIYAKIIMDVFGKPESSVKRKITIFCKSKNPIGQPILQTIYIRDINNEFTKEYKQYTSDFL